MALYKNGNCPDYLKRAPEDMEASDINFHKKDDKPLSEEFKSMLRGIFK